MAPATPPSNLPVLAIRPHLDPTNTPLEKEKPHLLLLPAELRIICYTYAFSYPSPGPGWPSQRLSPLCTCKQIYREASLLAFSLNVFIITLKSLSELPSRLRRLRDEQIRCIRNLTVLIDPETWHEYEPQNHEGYLPLFNSLGYPRLKLDALTISFRRPASHAHHFFLNFFEHWMETYYRTRNTWMDADSALELPQTLFLKLVEQWLNAFNVNKVLLVDKDAVYTKEFEHFWNFGLDFKDWKIEEDDGKTLEITRIKLG